MIDEAIFTLLKQWSQPFLNGRVSLSTAADKVTIDLPKLKFTPLGGPIDHTDDGVVKLQRCRVQLDLFTKSVVEGRAGLKAIRDAAHAYPGGTVKEVPIVRTYFDAQPTVASVGVVADQSNEPVARLTCDLLVDYRD